MCILLLLIILGATYYLFIKPNILITISFKPPAKRVIEPQVLTIEHPLTPIVIKSPRSPLLASTVVSSPITSPVIFFSPTSPTSCTSSPSSPAMPHLYDNPADDQDSVEDVEPDNFDSNFEGIEVNGQRSSRGNRSSSSAMSASSFTLSSNSTVLARRSSQQEAQASRRTFQESLTAKNIPPEELDQVRTTFEKKKDERVRFTLRNGRKRLQEVDESNPTPTIAIYYIPGGDQAEVNRMEGKELSGQLPEQKDALWRTNTAVPFFSEFYVNRDLSIAEIDKTEEIIVRMKHRATGERHNNGFLNVLGLSTIGDRDVLIDSDNVTIVDGTSDPRSYDVHSTAIEVDQSSLLGLMHNYRQLINKDGAAVDMSPDQIIELLEIMIEDARRLFIRSPALARMSTRLRIANSYDTRYGFDDGCMFRTWTTSKGISEMIDLGASYYHSLQTYGEAVQNQIKPKFLQMIVLLLSFLNRHDLESLKDLLEQAFRFRADPVDMEVVFLKVLPLLSLASSVFLEGAISAFELKRTSLGKSPPEKLCSDNWDILISRIMQRGYFLPSPSPSDAQIRQQSSWIPKWHDFKDSSIFDNLQCTDSKNILNHVPPLKNNTYTREDQKVTAILTNDRSYSITSQDLRKLTSIIQGIYILNDSVTGQEVELEVSEELVNNIILRAVASINKVIAHVNEYFSRPAGGWLTKAASKETWYNDIKSAGKLTRLVCKMGPEVIAIIYKQDKKKISKSDLNRSINTDLRAIETVIGSLETRLKKFQNQPRGLGGETKSKIRDLRGTLDAIRQDIMRGDLRRRNLSDDLHEFSDEIVKRELSQNTDNGMATSPWLDHEIRMIQDGTLQVVATRHVINEISWDRSGNAEIRFDGSNGPRAIAKPIGNIRADDVMIDKDDLAIMAGRIIIIAGENRGKTYNYGCLHLLDYVKAETPRRMRRFEGEDPGHVVNILV